MLEANQYGAGLRHTGRAHARRELIVVGEQVRQAEEIHLYRLRANPLGQRICDLPGNETSQVSERDRADTLWES
jgi:hypothetical protein